jgi:hypothetical protein
MDLDEVATDDRATLRLGRAFDFASAVLGTADAADGLEQLDAAVDGRQLTGATGLSSVRHGFAHSL